MVSLVREREIERERDRKVWQQAIVDEPGFETVPKGVQIKQIGFA